MTRTSKGSMRWEPAIGSQAAASEGDETTSTTGFPANPDWIPSTRSEADGVVAAWSQRKVDALLRERGLDDEVETTRRFVLETIPEYADRFLLELVQNAYDALPQAGGGRISIQLRQTSDPAGAELIVANTGTPFRFRDFRSISRMAQSEKHPGEGIGHKGVGFKSVLQVCPYPEIYSIARREPLTSFSGFCITYPRPDQYDAWIPGAGTDVPAMSPYSLPVPIEGRPPAVLDLRREGFVTAVRLEIDATALQVVQRAVQELLSSAAPILLFLDRAAKLTIQIFMNGELIDEHVLRRQSCGVAAGSRSHVRSVDLGEGGKFLVAYGEADERVFRNAIEADIAAHRTGEQWKKWSGSPFLGVAIPLDANTSDCLYCHLPLHESAHSPLGGHINAPFAIGLARKSLVPESQINEVLLDTAAAVSVDAALALRSKENLRQSVVDFAAWREQGHRVVFALASTGVEPTRVELVPVLGPRRWAAFGAAVCWDPVDTTVMVPSKIARMVREQLADPGIGAERLQALTRFAWEGLAVDMEPTPELLAAWTEAAAKELHGQLTNSEPYPAQREEWLALYDDLPRLFSPTTSKALAGKAIILGEGNALLRTWAEPAEHPGRRVQPGVFFARSSLEDADQDTTEERLVPRSLRNAIARVHPDLDWFVRPETVRRNRPGRTFLEDQGLVRLPRIPDMLQLVRHVLITRRSAQVWRDALIFVYRITRPGARRPDMASLGLPRLGLRVPTVGGWQRADRCQFSRGWTSTGALLSEFVEAGGNVSTEISALSAHLLAPPEQWLPRNTVREDWTELLRHCGVADGLLPAATARVQTPVVNEGWWWSDLTRVAARYHMNERDTSAWLGEARLGSWPRHPGAGYVASRVPQRIPGQSDYEVLPERAKVAFASLVLLGLGTWPDSALSFDVARRVGQGDPISLPSPAAAFLKQASWLRVNRPGSGGEDDWAEPGSAWMVAPDEREPYFAPVIDARLRKLISDSPVALARLVRVGAHSWSDPAHSVARLFLLGRLLRDGRVLPGLLAQVRNAVLESWRSIIHAQSPLPSSQERDLVVARGDRLETLSFEGSEMFFIPASSDRMLERVLASIGEPVLVVDGDLGSQCAALLQSSGCTAGRLIGPRDLAVIVDGQRAESVMTEADALLAGRNRWLEDLVALTMELKPSEFRPITAKVVGAALERLAKIRVIPATELALMLDGDLREVPAQSRHVVTTIIGDEPVIAWVPDSDVLTWRGLGRLAPAIAELINERSYRDAIENVARALGEGKDLIASEPDDHEWADAFGVSVERIQELRTSQRGQLAEVVARLVPLLSCRLNIEEGVALRRAAAGKGDEDLAPILKDLVTRMPEVQPLIHVAETSHSISEARQRLGISLASLNRVLVELGHGYSPETYAEDHSNAMAGWLALHRDRIVDSLRVQTLDQGRLNLKRLGRYAESVRALDSAIRTARKPASSDLLAPDPDWIMEYEEPPESLISSRVEQWLGSQGASGLDAVSGLPPASHLRTSNGALLARDLPQAAAIVEAWLDRHGVAGTPRWLDDPAALANAMAASGALDFEQLDQSRIVTALVESGHWPVEMPKTLVLTELKLSDDDVAQRKTAAGRRLAMEQRARAGLEVAGRVVTLEKVTIEDTVEHLLATSGKVLETPTREAVLGPPPPPPHTRSRRAGIGGRRGATTVHRVPPERLETIGFVGEFVAWHWLRRHYGDNAVLWRSQNRALVIHDGDEGADDLGYDFEVITARTRLYYEVKSSVSDPRAFELSESEVLFAYSKAKTRAYRVLYIANVGDPESRYLIPCQTPLGSGVKSDTGPWSREFSMPSLCRDLR